MISNYMYLDDGKFVILAVGHIISGNIPPINIHMLMFIPWRGCDSYY